MEATDQITVREEALELGALLHAIGLRCSESAARRADRVNLSEAQARALAAFRDDRSVRIGELARRMQLAPSRLTRLMDSLADRDLVARLPDPEDRRATFVSLTAAGGRAKELLDEGTLECYRGLITRLEPARRSRLLELLRELSQHMDCISLQERAGGNGGP